MLPLNANDNDNNNIPAKKQQRFPNLFLFFCFLAVIFAFGTWILAYSFPIKNISISKDIMDEKCFANFVIVAGILQWKDSEYLKQEQTKFDQKLFMEKFQKYLQIRKQFYFIDPMYFLIFVYSISTMTIIYNIFCGCMFKRNYKCAYYFTFSTMYFLALLFIAILKFLNMKTFMLQWKNRYNCYLQLDSY